MQRTYLIIGSILSMIGVGIGAFGAHLLEPIIGTALMQTFKTGVEYHFVHTLAILIVAVLAGVIGESSLLRWAGRLFTAGVIIFSGSLYVLSITGIKVLGAITPIGGVFFIAGWLMLAIAGAKYGKRS